MNDSIWKPCDGECVFNPNILMQLVWRLLEYLVGKIMSDGDDGALIFNERFDFLQNGIQFYIIW